MRLDLRDIIHVPDAEKTFHYQLDLSQLDFWGRKPIDQPVTAEGSVTNHAGALVLEGTARSTLELACDRCGRDMELFSDWVSTNNSFRCVFVCHHCKLFKRCTIKFIELNGGMDVKISYRTAHELTEANNEPAKKSI